MKYRKILIIPDASRKGSSGGTVTQMLVSYMKKIAFGEICIYCSDIKHEYIADDVIYEPAPNFSGTANLLPWKYEMSFKHMLDKYNPTHVFFVGSITNKPLFYLREATDRNLKTCAFIFMQDFYCAKIYANDEFGPCRKCLDCGLHYSFKSSCGAKSLGRLRLLERFFTRVRLRKLLSKIDYVGTSTDEQVDFYVDFGIDKSHTFKLPLPFDCNKTKGLTPIRGGYFLGIAQNRIEKGFHFIESILRNTKTKLILAYYNDMEKQKALDSYDLNEFIQKGQLELVVASWKSGLSKLLAEAQGVIIPSIWPTTTEYGWLEALSIGKPVVAFDISAHKEYVTNKKDGYLCTLGDFKSFGNCMDEIERLTDSEYSQLCGNVKQLYSKLTDDSGWLKFLNNL